MAAGWPRNSWSPKKTYVFKKPYDLLKNRRFSNFKSFWQKVVRKGGGANFHNKWVYRYNFCLLDLEKNTIYVLQNSMHKWNVDLVPSCSIHFDVTLAYILMCKIIQFRGYLYQKQKNTMSSCWVDGFLVRCFFLQCFDLVWRSLRDDAYPNVRSLQIQWSCSRQGVLAMVKPSSLCPDDFFGEGLV